MLELIEEDGLMDRLTLEDGEREDDILLEGEAEADGERDADGEGNTYSDDGGVKLAVHRAIPFDTLNSSIQPLKGSAPPALLPI